MEKNINIATLTIYSSKLCDIIVERITNTGSFTTVTDNDPTEILPISLGLLCLDLFNDLNITHVGIIRKGQRVSTGQVRVNVTDVFELPEPLDMNKLVSAVDVKFQTYVEKAFSVGYKKVAPNTSEQILKAMLALFPKNDRDFQRLISKIKGRKLPYTNPRIEDAAVEKDALGIALDIFGVDRSDILRNWIPTENESGKFGDSFLTGLVEYTSYEDDIINRDLRTIPGMEFIVENIAGVAEFENNHGEKLTVINANRKPQEKAMGVDLIYFHRQYDAFTFVQYKMMDRDDSEKETYYNPNDKSHHEELERMRRLINQLEKQPISNSLSDFRFSFCPVFFKVCKKIQMKQNDGSITPGAYIPFDQWNLLLNDPSTLGSRGGRKISFKTLNRRYIGTQTFADLVQRGLIGTQSENSRKIGLFVEDAIRSGHSVMYAIDASIRRSSGDDGTDRNIYTDSIYH